MRRGDQGLGRVLADGELGRRLARQRRRRRRVVGLLVLVVMCAALAAVAFAGGRSPRAAHRAAAAPAVEQRVRIVPPRIRRPSALVAAVERTLRDGGYVRLAGTRRREVALTFDDGPGPYTAAILTVLERTHTPATFFTVGRMIRYFWPEVAREARDHDVVGDHTETHPMLSLLRSAAQRSEIGGEAQAIVGAGAPWPDLFRPPYGAFNRTTLRLLRQLRMVMVLWSVDTEDYLRPGVARLLHTVARGTRPGAIILLHDGGGNRAQTVAALPGIIGLLRRRGYRLVAIPQLLIDDPPPPHQPPPQPLSGLG